MFELAMAARRERGMGVVGSTQNILDFIAAKLSAALEQPFGDKCATLPQTGLSLLFLSPAQRNNPCSEAVNAMCSVVSACKYDLISIRTWLQTTLDALSRH